MAGEISVGPQKGKSKRRRERRRTMGEEEDCQRTE